LLPSIPRGRAVAIAAGAELGRQSRADRTGGSVARYRGPRSNRVVFSKGGDHGCADLVHASTAGASHEASSSDPALMNASCGATAAMLKTGEPHAEQNFRSVSPPWSSPVVTNEASVLPSTLNVSRGTATITENGLPVWRWQSVQWQTA
jgi:hypothetical protein